MEVKRKHLHGSWLQTVCMVIMMVFFFMPAGIVSADTKDAIDMCEVTINVAPKEAAVTFYEGEEANKLLASEWVTDKGIVDDYHQYVLNVPKGRYSYRAIEGETYLGGMTFDVPVEAEIMFDPETGGGKPSEEGQVLTLVRQNYYVNSERINKSGDYTMRAIPGGMPDVVFGTQYNNDDDRIVTPVMILARGNALVYQISATINGDLGESYCVTPMPYETFTSSKTTIPKPLALVGVSLYQITAPQGAKVQMFQQVNNYNVAEIPASKSSVNSDDTVTYQYKAAGAIGLSYRVSMEGKITRAGYFKNTSDSVVITFDENENPSTLKNDTGIQNRMESSTMVNVNRQNLLNLGVGDTFRLRAYRAAWQIINTDGGNIMIEPDFHYNIISGEDCIELLPITNKCTGNAGYGEQANWMDIRGIKEGIAILEVSYDAINIGGDTGYKGIYGATHPSRTSLIVIKVGGTENTLNMKGDGCQDRWDTEYDTLYFTGESGDMTFTATIGDDVPDKVEISIDQGSTWEEVDLVDGKYTAKGLVPGNSILKFTKGTTIEYQVVRGAKVTYTITNKSHDIENLYMVGDKLEIHFDGLFMPVPKFSGIYNPGFGTKGQAIYDKADGVTQEGVSGQYSFITDNILNITLTQAGELLLDEGQIHIGVYGHSNSTNEHRLLTDRGCGINFSAVDVYYVRSMLPSISLNVVEKQEAVNVKFDSNSDADSLTVMVTNNKSGEETLVENGEIALGIGKYTYEATAKNRERTTGTFEVVPNAEGKIIVSITMRELNDTEWDGISIEEAPVEGDTYQISKAAQLAWFAQQVNNGTGVNWNAVLMKDISLGTNNPWTPMMDYAGVFDGNGHCITNLYINVSKKDNQALFGRIIEGAVIKNLGVDGKVIVTYTGSPCRNTGGIIGDAGSETTIENCVNRVDVSGVTNVGGVVGRLGNRSSVLNCYNIGTISGNQQVGGIVGELLLNSGQKASFKIRNCYNTGMVDAVSKAGAISYESIGKIAKNSYYLKDTCNLNVLVGGTEVTSDELKALAATLGSAYLPGVEEYNNGYPVLTWEESRILSYVAEDAIADIEAYKNPADYREAQKAELSTALAAAKSAISSAKTVADVNKAAADAKAAMDAIKTDAQLKAEEEANKPVTPPTEKPEEQPTQKPDETPETPTQLTAPSKVKVSNVAKSGKVKVTWSKVEGAAKYQVYRATKKNGKYTLVKTVTGTSYTDSTTKVGKSYYFKVKAVSSDKNVTASAFSKAVKGTVVLKAPSVTAKSKTKKQVKLTWKKVSGAKKYEIYRAASKNGKYKKIATTAKLSYTNKKLKSGKNYFYKVKAIGKKKAYNSAFSTVKNCKVK